jgi:thiamine kinase-like enzyme
LVLIAKVEIEKKSMVVERWNDARLDQLADQVQEIAQISRNHASLIESNARTIQSLANVAAEAREERQELLRLIAQQQASIERHQETIERHQETIERQQANIEGLRTETIRMLDLLLNQRNQQDNSEE